MKIFKWKVFIITSIICLVPILLGISIWEKLPEKMAIHFNIYGVPDNFASKGFVVFGIPMLMVVLQAFSCFTCRFTVRAQEIVADEGMVEPVDLRSGNSGPRVQLRL